MFTGLTFHAGAIAVAGLLAAAAPVIIHLLNRRRYRVVQWAAMDFLREALSRSRRAIELRDILLMVLRSLCLLLLGLALARPYFSASSASSSSSGPVHAVLVIDNSLSMAYERLDGTLLDAAKAKAREVLDQLPLGSRTSIIPLCASPGEFSWDAYRTQDDAIEALRTIEVVDRAGHASQAVERAREACRAVTDLTTKRVVFFGDQQATNWPLSATADLNDSTGGPDALEMHVVAVGADEPENSWIADIQLRDGLADTESDSVFQLKVRHEGPRPRTNVQVTLTLDGTEIGGSTIDLEPGQTREVSFTHRFDTPPASGQATFVAAEARLSPDRLPADDRRALVVPIVAALPVVFVDQFGDEEAPQRNEYGETFRLRRLLAPVTVRTDAGRQLVQIRRARIDQVDRELLADARLVVVAGVEKPDPAVAVLREYVQQGGQLLIAAGAEFSPANWQRAAWLDGAGILPAPLSPELVGSLPNDAAANLQPFFLSFDSMSHDLFQLADVPREELADLYQLPYFFQAAAADLGNLVLSDLLTADLQRLEEQRQFLSESDVRLARWAEDEAKGALTDEQAAERAADQRRRDEIEPHWLRWAPITESASANQPIVATARLMRPRPLALYTNNLPFLIERNIGRGQVTFCSTGVKSDWNTLTKTNAVLLFDRLFRAALARTLPSRNLSSSEPVVLPIAAEDRRATLSLRRPESNLDEPLVTEALQSDQFGVTIRNAAERGIYRITARQAASHVGDFVEDKLWEIPLSVSGPQEESQLAPLDQASWQERIGDAPFRWTAPGETINLSGVGVRGEGLWRWLLAGVLACLLAEIAILTYMGKRTGSAPIAGTVRLAGPVEADPSQSNVSSPPLAQEVRA